MCQRLRAEGNSELQSRELEKSTLERAVEEDVEREQQHLDQAHAHKMKGCICTQNTKWNKFAVSFQVLRNQLVPCSIAR